jgi:hypothetical protein
MVLKKKPKTFNDYTLEISFGQLEVIRAALDRDHADPVADELLAELGWYMDRVPGPGEEEEDVKAREEHPEGAAGAAGDETDGMPLPMPPHDNEGAAPEQEPPTPPEEGREHEGGEPMGGGGHHIPEPNEEEFATEETDRRLAAPPAE